MSVGPLCVGAVILVLFVSYTFTIFSCAVGGIAMDGGGVARRDGLVAEMVSWPGTVARALGFYRPTAIVDDESGGIGRFPIDQTLFTMMLTFPLVTLTGPRCHPSIRMGMPPRIFDSNKRSTRPYARYYICRSGGCSRNTMVGTRKVLLRYRQSSGALDAGPLI